MDAETASAIELRVDDISQLFDTLDPFPFRERDLDKDAEEYIVGWARELPSDQPLTIIVYLPAQKVGEQAAADLSQALRRYFDYRAGVVRRELNELFRIGRLSLVVGAVMLVLCLGAAQIAVGIRPPGPLGRLIEESLLILGWVSNWRPLEIFLYEWWPLARRRHLYGRLAASKVLVRQQRP